MTLQILVHTCCAPCFTYPHRQLKEEGHDVIAFFYNPNIHPYLEYRKRRETLSYYEKLNHAKVIYNDEYDIENYLRGSLSASIRCEFCYTLRLDRTARTAAQSGFDAFTTTLLISPYQKHDMLKEIGTKMSEKFGIEFYYKDFRTGYRESRQISKTMELYMQKYCGCIFSEKERYYPGERR